MFKHDIIIAAALCTFAAPALAASQPQEIDAIRAEFDQKFKALQAEYEARLKALEGRVQAAEAQAGQAQSSAQTAVA